MMPQLATVVAIRAGELRRFAARKLHVLGNVFVMNVRLATLQTLVRSRWIVVRIKDPSSMNTN